MGKFLTSGSNARSGACQDGSSVGWRLVSTMLAEIGGFRKVIEGGFGKKVLD